MAQIPDPPLTNEDILHNLRCQDEWDHRRHREYFFKDRPLTLDIFSPVPQIDLEHIQDSCNKFTAIYSITPHLEPNTRAYIQFSANRSDIIYNIYQQWFRSHNIDIDFGNFVAKLISLKLPSDDRRAKIEDVVNIHEKWCKHVETTLPSCSKNKDLTDSETEDCPWEPHHGSTGINQRQNSYYSIRPLFRTLIIVIDDQTNQEGPERIVHLVRTNLASEISAPLTFASIRPQFEQTMFVGCSREQVVTTTLSAAVDFVTTLELREQDAFPERKRDPSVIHERIQGYHMDQAKSKGYTGPQISRSSSSWVKLPEGEDVIPPATPFTLMKALRMGWPKPRDARKRRLIKKEPPIIDSNISS